MRGLHRFFDSIVSNFLGVAKWISPTMFDKTKNLLPVNGQKVFLCLQHLANDLLCMVGQSVGEVEGLGQELLEASTSLWSTASGTRSKLLGFAIFVATRYSNFSRGLRRPLMMASISSFVVTFFIT